VDASFVAAPRQRNSREENQKIKQGERPGGFEADTAKGRQKDCDARWTKKNNETHYGYKNHAKVDAKSSRRSTNSGAGYGCAASMSLGE
jgi:IS5 family transposase